MDHDSRKAEQEGPERSGFAEIDRAIAENRLFAYRLKKAWADPWERRGLWAFAMLVAAFAVFVVIHDIIG